ncbi:MAG: hypothetical protein ACYC3I_04465 [Gemmataceae bacterium]
MITPVILQGTLKPDGTLELDHKPSLAPGRVQVIVQPLPQPAARKRGLADVIDEISQAQHRRGYTGLPKEEMEAEEATRRAEEEDYDQRMRDLWSQTRSGPPAGAP